MRDLAILEEWLTKERAMRRDNLQKSLIGATNDMHRIHAQNMAHVIENITQTIEGIRLLDKSPEDFVKRFLT